MRAIATLTQGIALPEDGTLKGAADPRGYGYHSGY